MNERIWDLWDQATLDPTNEDAHDLVEKFAELLVGECCSFLQTENIQHDSYGYNQNFLHKKIKDHFGV